MPFGEHNNLVKSLSEYPFCHGDRGDRSRIPIARSPCESRPVASRCWQYAETLRPMCGHHEMEDFGSRKAPLGAGLSWDLQQKQAASQVGEAVLCQGPPRCRAETVGAACRALVHLPESRPVNRSRRWPSRIALRLWGSRPRCDREQNPHRKNHSEDKSERFPCHVSLLAQIDCP
jgi:hypothetical protein